MNRLYIPLLVFICCFNSAVAQWKQLKAPSVFDGEVGNITCITTNDSFVWVGTEKSGIFRYDNLSPTQWEASNNGVQTYSAFSLTYNKGNLITTTDKGIYLSTNNGNSWKAINNGLPLGGIITSFTTSNSTLFASTTNFGIFRSTDNGQNWTQANNGLLDNNILQVKADSSAVWALSRNAGLFKSTNNGQSWSTISVPNNCLKCTEIAIIDSTIFIAQGSLLVSKNSGSSWGFDSSVKNIKSITAYKGRLIANSDYRLYESYDSGKKWFLEFEFNLDSLKKINTSLSTPNSIKYTTTANSGLYRGQIAAVTWKPFNFGLLTADVKQIEWENGILYASAYGNIYRSGNNGDSWVETDDFFKDRVSSFVISNDKIIVSSDTSGIRIADTQFFVWKDANTGLDNKQVNKVLKRGNTLYALTMDGIYRSPNDGDNWFKQANAINGLIFTDLLFTNGVLYAGTNKGLYKSTNGGNSFSEVDSINIPRRYVHFIHKINNKLWLKVGIDTHISEDDGATWPRHYYSWGITFAHSVSVVKNLLYASTTSGYFFRDTANETWHFLKEITGGLRANVFQSSGTHLFAGTGAGIWRLPLSNVLTSIADVKQKNSLNIYPNPATHTITIDNKANEVAIYSLNGKKVLACKQCNTLNISDLTAGIYIIKAQSEKGVFTQKLIKE